jgi:hypothetical protein
MYTGAVIHFYAFAIHNQVRSMWSGFWLGRYDRFALDLQLEGYVLRTRRWQRLRRSLARW